MTNKLPHPELAPIYELDRSLDTVLGFDHLRHDVHALSQLHPQDEHHLALRQVADVAIASFREDEVERSIGLTREIKRSRIDRKIETASGLEDAKQRHRDQSQVIMELERAPGGLFNTVLSEATEPEREIVRGIVQRKVDSVKGTQAEIGQEMSEIRKGIDYAKSVLNRPIEKKPDTPEKIIPEIEEKTFVTDPTIKEFNQIVNILREVKGNLVDEQDLVRVLYPELYRSNRPAAYSQFDAAFTRFKAMDMRRWNDMAGTYIQRGNLFKANKAGQPINGQPRIVYRIVWGDQENIIKSTDVVEQRITMEEIPHVVRWDRVLPSRSRPQ